MCDAALERSGSSKCVDRGNNRERAIELLPTLHEGPSVCAIERETARRAYAESMLDRIVHNAVRARQVR